MGDLLLAAELAVHRPGHGPVAGKGDLPRFKAHHRAVLRHLQGGEGGEDGLPVLGGFGLADQNDLEPPVVQQHLVPGQVHQPPHRHGVAHHAIDEVVLHLAAVGGHGHVIAGDAGQPPHPFQNIGEMAQQIFVRLGGGIGHVGKQPKGCYISKETALGLPHIHQAGDTIPRHLRQLGHRFGQLQGAGEIVGGARRDVAQHRPLFLGQRQQAPHSLVQRAVPAGAHHPVVVRPPLLDDGGGIPPLLGRVDGDLIALAGKHLQRVGQVGLGGPPPGGGVIDVQKLFHRSVTPSFLPPRSQHGPGGSSVNCIIPKSSLEYNEQSVKPCPCQRGNLTI